MGEVERKAAELIQAAELQRVTELEEALGELIKDVETQCHVMGRLDGPRDCAASMKQSCAEAREVLGGPIQVRKPARAKP